MGEDVLDILDHACLWLEKKIHYSFKLLIRNHYTEHNVRNLIQHKARFIIYLESQTVLPNGTQALAWESLLFSLHIYSSIAEGRVPTRWYVLYFQKHMKFPLILVTNYNTFWDMIKFKLQLKKQAIEVYVLRFRLWMNFGY